MTQTKLNPKYMSFDILNMDLVLELFCLFQGGFENSRYIWNFMDLGVWFENSRFMVLWQWWNRCNSHLAFADNVIVFFGIQPLQILHAILQERLYTMSFPRTRYYSWVTSSSYHSGFSRISTWEQLIWKNKHLLWTKIVWYNVPKIVW